jgi:hypothetical protein
MKRRRMKRRRTKKRKKRRRGKHVEWISVGGPLSSETLGFFFLYPPKVSS